MKEMLFVKNNKVFFFFLSILFSFFLGIRFPHSVHAQIPSPTPVPCDETRDAEFHSLRPYQASPCNSNEDELALYCANDILLTDRFSITDETSTTTDITEGTSGFNKTCTDLPEEGIILCNYVVDRVKNIAIDLTRAELPIAGNTEDLRNFSNTKTIGDEPIDAKQRINEYVSWYLNGINNRAEYSPLAIDNKTDSNNNGLADGEDFLVNYSGPLNKLLPLRIQIRERLDQVADASDSVTNDAQLRHNQIVGCTAEKTEIFPAGAVTFSKKTTIPVPCNNLTWWQEILTLTTGEQKRRLAGNNGTSDWANIDNQPPLEEEFNGQPFADYWKAYKEWRGNVCAQLPLPGVFSQIVLCVNPPDSGISIPDYISELFPYIPYSSTEDRVGNFRLESLPPPLPQAGDPGERGPIRINNERISGEPDSELYYSHMEEDTQLADLLQQTFVSKDLDTNAPVDPLSTTLVGGEFCNLAQVKTNPGDDLFGNDFETQLSYSAGFTCEYVLPERPPTASCSESATSCEQECFPGPFGALICRDVCNSEPVRCAPNGYSCSQTFDGDCGAGYQCGAGCDAPDVNSCDITTFHTIPTYTDTPYADDLWAKLVAGPASVFKKIFPKIGVDGPLAEIVDIPAASGLSYSTTDQNTDVTAGGVRPGASAELYFPHLGGIHEYFLQCTQELLRPQGFGPGCGDVEAPYLIGGSGEGDLLSNVTINAGDGKLPFILGWQNTVHLAFNPATDIVYWSKLDSASNFTTGTKLADVADDPDRTAGSLGVAPDGTLYYIWTNNVGGVSTVYMKKKPSNGVWQSSPTIISNTSSSTSGGNSASRIGVSGNTVVAVWGQGGKYRYNTSTNAGTSWANVRELDSQYSHPYIATNTNGKLIVGYTTGDPNYVKVAVWNGNSFSISTVAQGKTGPYGFLANPTAAVSPDGSEHVAWRDADKGGIYYGTRGVNGGQWAVTKLNASTANDTVGISSDSQGGLHLAWATNTPAGLYYMYKSPSGSWTNPTFVANTSGKLWNAAKTAGTSQNGIYGHAVVEDWSGAPAPTTRYFLFTIKEGASGFPTPPPGSACTNLPNSTLQQWGLPTITDSGTGPGGYMTLLSSIRNNPDADWAVKEMLKAEDFADGKGFNVSEYFTTAWMWLEGGSGYPNPYSLNCNDNRTITLQNGVRYTYQSTVSFFCNDTNFQIAGYRASKNYLDVYNRLYPTSTDQSFRSLLSRVVNDSTHAGTRSGWKYQGTSGLMQYLNNVLATGTSNQLAVSGEQLTGNGTFTPTAEQERRQFLTLITGKDPNMVAAMNADAVSGNLFNNLNSKNPPADSRYISPGNCAGTSCSNCTYGYICGAEEKRLSNIVTALYLYKNGCQTAGTPPTP